mmetsp:Transcript_3142/g.2708  ORF Transcript_3142/g.2708 Transcript_3142/m.2708 type:complete len:118 (-) Transcript_3142:1221-1574(-)
MSKGLVEMNLGNNAVNYDTNTGQIGFVINAKIADESPIEQFGFDLFYSCPTKKECTIFTLKADKSTFIDPESVTDLSIKGDFTSFEYLVVISDDARFDYLNMNFLQPRRNVPRIWST